MTYRVEYNGDDIEVATLDAALENAKHAIAADVGSLSGWTVEHDDTINDWFVQGVRDGQAVGPTAVVSGPEPVLAADPARPTEGELYGAAGADTDGWMRRVSFTGATPAEVFGTATTWLSARQATVGVSDVSWRTAATGYQMRVYYRDGA